MENMDQMAYGSTIQPTNQPFASNASVRVTLNLLVASSLGVKYL